MTDITTTAAFADRQKLHEALGIVVQVYAERTGTDAFLATALASAMLQQRARELHDERRRLASDSTI
jgi:hypothetical protein